LTVHTHTSAGIAIAVLSALLSGSGTVVEKVALQRLPELHARHSWGMVRTLFGSRAWLLGCAMLVLGLGCQGLALSLAPISVAQPIFALGIVLLLVLSHFVLHDRLGRVEWLGVTTIVAAVVLLGFSVGPGADRAGGPARFLDLALAAIPTCAVALAVFVAADRADKSKRRARSLRGPLFGIAAGLFYGVTGLGLKAAATLVQRSGLVGAIPRLVTSPSLYLLVGTCAVGLLLFQTGLQRCSASVVAPVNVVTSTAYVIGVGTVLFNEHLPADAGLLALRLGGFAGVVVGLVTLAVSGGRGGAEDASGERAGLVAPGSSIGTTTR
jgi:drug/metabolite transporter (DMT)-like permease